MRFALGLFLLFFWGGIALIVLSNLGIVAMSAWLIFIFWILIIIIAIAAFIVLFRYIDNDEHKDENEVNNQVEHRHNKVDSDEYL